MTSLNSFSPKIRRRRGSTSPPLTNIHPNPGPHHKPTERQATKPPKEGHVPEEERIQFITLHAQGLSAAEIGRRMGRKPETVWITRYDKTGNLDCMKPGPKPVSQEDENHHKPSKVK